MLRNDEVPEDTGQLVRDLGDDASDYAGKISIYDDSIFIADAAL